MSNSAGLGAATEAIVRSEKLWMKNTGAQPQRKWNAEEEEDEGGRGGMKVMLLRPQPEGQREEGAQVEVLRPMSAPEEWEGQGGGGGGGRGGEGGGEFDATWLSGGESRRFHHENFEKVLKEKETQRTVQVDFALPQNTTHPMCRTATVTHSNVAHSINRYLPSHKSQSHTLFGLLAG
jgi:hypothetical protein